MLLLTLSLNRSSMNHTKKGTAFETRTVEFLRGALPGSVRVYRPAQRSRLDIGDIWLGENVIIQCKDYKTWSRASLQKWIRDARTQAKHAGRDYGVVVVKSRREAEVSGGSDNESLVFMSGETFAGLSAEYAEACDRVVELEARLEILAELER